MSTECINKSHDEEIIDIARRVVDNRTGKAKTPYEHVLIKLMQLRGTPISSVDFNQKRVDFNYDQWVADKAI